MPSSVLEIGGQKYKLMAAVCEVATLARTGYQYKAMLSISGKWVHCTDLSMSTETWPRGSKGVYLLLYHAQSPVTTRKESSQIAYSPCKGFYICEATYSKCKA